MPQRSYSSRREFMLAASSVASAMGAFPALAGAAGAAIEPMKVGVFGLDYTFWGIWADLLSPKGKQLGTSVLRMRPTHVWDKNVRKLRISPLSGAAKLLTAMTAWSARWTRS